MSQISPFINQRTGRQNQPVIVPTEPLLVDPPAVTFLSADVAASSGSLTVANNTNLVVNQLLLIGDLGNQNSEIVKITSVSGTTVNISPNTMFAHTANTGVVVLYYDQVEFYSAATTTGAKTFLNRGSITANYDSTNYNDLAGTTGYYFARFRNSIGSTASVFSAPSPVDGYTIFSARAIIDAALAMINKNTSEVLSDEFAFQCLDACGMEVLREFKRWSWMQKFNTIIGTTQTGTFKIATPTDIDDSVTNKSTWLFRISKEPNMVWVGRDEFDALMIGTAWSTVVSATLTGASSLVLTSTRDFFQASGSIQVGPNVYTYSANDLTTNTLTLSSPLIADVPANQDVFQQASLGNPVYFTIDGGYIYHWPIVGPSYTGRNYYLSYYSKLVEFTTDYQSIVFPDPSVAQYYLAWKFLLRINNGEATTASDGMYALYQARLLKMKNKEPLNRNFILSPDLNGGGSYGGYGN